MVKLEILGTYYSHIGDFRYKIMRSLNANILFVVKCFKKAVMGSIIYIFNIWGRMTKYQRRGVEREREGGLYCCVFCYVGPREGDIPKYGERKREAPDTWANIAIFSDDGWWWWWWWCCRVLIVQWWSQVPLYGHGPVSHGLTCWPPLCGI